LSSKILAQNPEYYTVWNHRRRIHAATWAGYGDDGGESVAQDIEADLAFILPLMIKYPKCYWIWNFRLWLLDQATARLPAERARAFWQGEMGLVAKMLGRDRRNFHGWRFRRIVVEALEGASGASLTQQEFDYTTKMIGADLSNYSAWHYRSKLIPRLLRERGADTAAQRQMLDDGLTPLMSA
jgi:geranylgeranyl transferase type-2 subunit alpha